jgi:dinuclear metal center YbgI/SA1388 family protein
MNSYTREGLWQRLNSIAPLSLAGSWDNVGVLLDPEPPPYVTALSNEKILLTIDLTEDVFEEALANDYTIIVTYHPIIFGGLKRLTQQNTQTRILLKAAQKGIGVYSPHTALDAVKGGVCDWLAASITTPLEEEIGLAQALTKTADLFASYAPIEAHPSGDDQGAGRICNLHHPLTLEAICQRLEQRLNHNLSPQQNRVYLRIVTPRGLTPSQLMIKSLALCPGAGGSLFESLQHVDLLITGEMRHHDLLHVSQRGGAVILTEHSRCERGFLPFYQQFIEHSIDVFISCAQSDDDPLSLFIQ